MPTTILDNETYPEALQRRYAEETKAEKQAEIIRMANEACQPHQILNTDLEFLERFFHLAFASGAAHERENQAEQEPVTIGVEWKPCVKLPVVVHVREQREGESHVSTREGITPVKPDDLIMRGVAGEEYPIGRELFNKTYTFDTAAPLRTKDLTDDEVMQTHTNFDFDSLGEQSFILAFARAVIAADREKNNANNNT